MVGACVVGLCNPNGLDGLLYPFRILLNYGVQITENLSPWALSRNAVNPMLLALPVLMILTVWALVWGFLAFLREVRASRAGGGDPLSGGRLANAIIALGALIASFSMARHTPLLALAGLPVVAHASRLSGAGRRSAWVLPVALVALGLNVFVGWAVIDGSWSRRFRAPTAPTAFGLDISERYEGLRQLAREYSLLGPVFSDFNIGSLVEYNLYPIPGYVDNRPEAFPMSFWNEEYYPAMASPARCRETLQRRGVNLVAPFSLESAASPVAAARRGGRVGVGSSWRFHGCVGEAYGGERDGDSGAGGYSGAARSVCAGTFGGAVAASRRALVAPPGDVREHSFPSLRYRAGRKARSGAHLHGADRRVVSGLSDGARGASRDRAI